MSSGESFGRYRLLGEIARGGMGVVHRAFDPVLEREVAHKVLLGEDPEEVARSQREVRTAANLRHPNIVAVHDVGVESARPYYTMDLIQGPSLANVVREMGKLPPRAAARIARDVARALEAAHEQGVVHRDIKPQNILLSPESSEADEKPSHDTSIRLGGGFTDRYRVLLADFGLAKDIDATKKLTISGSIVGTPAYMSPEQAQGDAVDARSDVYSLGAVLCEMLGGRAPFEASDVYKLLLKVIHDEPPPPAPALSEDLRTIAAKAMAKERGRRYKTAREFAEDLERYLGGEAIAARPASFWYRFRKRAARHKALTAAAVTGALALLGAAGYFLGPSWYDVRGRRHVAWPAGRHLREVRVEGYDPYWGEVQTSPWRVTKWEPPLVADHGFAVVRTEPTGAEVVFLDRGREVARGAADGQPIRVPKGAYDIVLRLRDHEDQTPSAAVAGGETVQINRILKHELGYLSVTCAPDGVSMTVAGRTYALPVERLELPTGRYVLRFEKDNHWPRETEVTVRKGGPPARMPDLAADGTGVSWRHDPGVTYAHATLHSRELWTFKTDGEVTAHPAIADLDGDGVPDCVVGSQDSKVYALSGRDGEPIAAPMPGSHARAHNGRLYVADGWSIKAVGVALKRQPDAALARGEVWKALAKRAPTDRLSYYYRGLAKLRLGKDPSEDFREAARLGLKSPELHAAWLEAGGRDLPENHPLTPHFYRGGPIPDFPGDAPHVLLLRGRFDDALAKLPQGDTWDWQALALRALAKRSKGDLAGARVDIEGAVKANPWNRDLKRLLGEIR